MTQSTAVVVLGEDPEPGSTDPAQLRLRAGQLALEAFIARERANAAYREADALEYQADLWEKADAAEDAATALHERTAPLEAAETAAVAAVREAEDCLRVARGRATRARNDEARADASGDLAASEDAAPRTAKAERNVGNAEAAVGARRAELAAAEKALADHNREISGATARCREAYAAAMNPGKAPRKHPNLVSFGSPDDMSDTEKQHFALLLGLTSVASRSDGNPQEPSQAVGGWNWRQDLAHADASKPRIVRQGRSTVIIPPVLMPGGPGR